MRIRDENWRQQLSTRIAFLIAGVGFSTLAPLVPTIKERFHFDEGALGLLLLCVGLGSITVMPFGGLLASRFGCRKVMAVSAIALIASLPAFIVSPNIPLLAGSLLLMGAGGGTLDVVMNIQAVMVEEASKRPMMSGFHGLFSVGGIVGAGGLTALLSLGIPPGVCQLLIALLCLAMLLATASSMLPFGPPANDGDRKGLVFPRGKVFLIGVLCGIVFMAEGSIADWSGVLLTKFRHINPAQAGLGYVAFASMMTLNRLTGDRVVASLGGKRVVLLGAVCGGVGFLLAATIPLWPVSVLGFGMVGIGLANVVPILFSATGRQDDMPSNLALSSASTMGYIGLLAGPPLLGFVARQTSLPVSLTALTLLCVFVAFQAKKVGT